MREILFRGKDVATGLWFEGDLVRKRDGNPCIRFWRAYCYSGRDVFRSTVSQFTGFFDKKGKRIFEGDILRSVYPDEPFEPAVVFEVVYWNNGWYQANGGEEGMFDDMRQDYLNEYSEVVGNIWDNPELLTEGEK